MTSPPFQAAAGQQGPQIQLRNLFATPVAVFPVPDAARINAAHYVRDGGAGENQGVGGEFEIQDPRGIGPAMLAPHLAFRSAGGLSVGASELVAPRAGNLVMFPSWLSHGVRLYSGDDVRISIALNLTPE